jgi:hypothetical protein
MSVEIRPEFEPPGRGPVYQAEGKALADRIRAIHTFCKKRGIRPITDFLDNRDMPEDDLDEDAWKAARRDWYPAAVGLDAVRALMTANRSDAKVMERWNRDDPDAVETLLDDLEQLARCLEAAAAGGVRFRLDVG